MKLENKMKKIHQNQNRLRQLEERKINTHDLKNGNTFYKRSENLTNMQFTKEETHLLMKGLYYNLHH
jgi:hypothetical protein